MSKKIIEQETESPTVQIPAAVPPSPSATLMYCGPAIPGVSSHGMLFTAMPEALTQYDVGCPAIKSFIVAPKDYVKVKQEIDRKGSLLNIQYQTVLKHLQRSNL